MNEQRTEKVIANNKGYKLDEVSVVIEKMANFMRNPPNDWRVLKAFLENHPWMRKYLSHFSEANQLREMAKSPDFAIVRVEMSEKERLMRERHKLNTNHLLFQTPLGMGGQYTFRFARSCDGLYYSTNG